MIHIGYIVLVSYERPVGTLWVLWSIPHQWSFLPQNVSLYIFYGGSIKFLEIWKSRLKPYPL